MATCPRCKASYPGESIVCPACTGRPAAELRAVAAGPTVPLSQSPAALGAASTSNLVEATLDLGRERAEARPQRLRPAGAGRAADTEETASRGTPVPSGEERPKAADTVETEARDPLIGQTPLGQYRITEKIGEGSFGAVYIAEQTGVGRKAVIKVLHQRLMDSEIFVKRFRREAAILAALDHHHLVRLYNFGELEAGQLFLAMEYGGDRTLADEIRLNGKLGVERALRITEQVCSALHEAHARGVVHRDLKPSNIMLGRKEGQDWVKVVDVGIAKILHATDMDRDDGHSRLTQSGMIIGTPAYFSPEQARGLDLDGRSDVYAMGCILYEMLSGKLPIEALSPVDFVRAHCTDAPVPLRSLGIAASAPVEVLLKRALSKLASERPTASEMAEMAAAARKQFDGDSTFRPGRRVAAAVLGVFACAALVAVWLARDRTPPPSSVPAPPPMASASSPPTDSTTPPRTEAKAATATEVKGTVAVATPTPAPTEPARIREAPSAALAEDTAPAVPVPTPDRWRSRIAHVNELVHARELAEAIGEARKALGESPPKQVKGALYKALGTAFYDNGDSVAALKYFRLYRTLCPARERSGLDRRIDELSAEVGLARAH